MKNVVKVWLRIIVIISLIMGVLGILIVDKSSAKITIAVLLAVRLTLAGVTASSLDTNNKSITLGVFDIILLFPVVGILYLCWEPKGGKVYL